ncbi:unnamed protein product, partial [Mesorhabditis spiculigera]
MVKKFPVGGGAGDPNLSESLSETSNVTLNEGDDSAECSFSYTPIQPFSQELISRDRIGRELFAVDLFRVKKKILYHFLTHGHQDHYGSIGKNWNRPIYCTPTTAALLPHLTRRRTGQQFIRESGVREELMQRLQLGVAQDFDNFRVTALDANHCLGAAMLLFEGEDPIFQDGPILFTGDIRADRTLMERFETNAGYKRLSQLKLGHIFLDDTYLCDEAEHFPARDELIPKIVDLARTFSPTLKLLLPLHKLGKEDVLVAVARGLKEKICLDPGRWESRELLFPPEDLEYFVGEEDPQDARIFVCLRRRCGEVYQHLFSQGIDAVVINLTKQKISLSRHIHESICYNFPYSDHSSYTELVSFCSRLRTKFLHPWSGKVDVEHPRWKRLRSACTSDTFAEPPAAKQRRLADSLTADLEEIDCTTTIPISVNGIDMNEFAPALNGAK